MRYLSIIYGNCENSKTIAKNWLKTQGFQAVSFTEWTNNKEIKKGYISDLLSRQEIIEIKKTTDYSYKSAYFINRHIKWAFDKSELDIRDELRNNIDTTFIDDANIKKIIEIFFDINSWDKPLLIFKSFGFKYGIIQDLDMIFNVRILPNPYWNETLRHISGENQEIVDFVLKDDFSKKYCDQISLTIKDFLDKSLIKPNGKHLWVMALACTGGMHRSVVSANLIANQYTNLTNKYNVIVWHDNLNKIKVI